MSSTPLSYQDLLILSQQLSNTDNPQTREHLIAQLISTIEQRMPTFDSIDPFLFENIKAQQLALSILEQNAVHVPIDKIVRMLFCDDPAVSMTAEKLITIRKLDISAKPFLEGLKQDDYPTRYKAMQGLKAMEEYAPREILISTANSDDCTIASIAAEALILLREPLLLTPLLENFMTFHRYMQLKILLSMNQINAIIPMELLTYALHHPTIEIRKAALKGAAKYGKDAPIEAIENAVRDGATGLEAIQTLGEIADYKNNHLFIEILHDSQILAEMRVEAAHILSHKGQNVPIQPLLALLFHDDTMQSLQTRIHTILNEIGEASVEDILSYAHNAATISAQIAAFQILSAMDEPSLPAKLREIVNNKQFSERLRRTAMNIIGERKEQSAADALWSVLQNNEDDKLKEHAHSTLRALGQIDEYELYTPFGLPHFNSFNSFNPSSFMQNNEENLQNNPLNLMQNKENDLQNNLTPLIEIIIMMQNEQQNPQEIAQAIADKLFEIYHVEGPADLFLGNERSMELKYPLINLAISTLDRLSDERALTILQTLLYHEDLIIRIGCIFILLHNHPESVLVYLSDNVNAMDETSRVDGTLALSRFQESLQIQPTSKQEEIARNREMQQAAAAILEKMAVPFLPEIVFNENDIAFNQSFTQSLKPMDEHTQLETLQAELSDNDIYVRINALLEAAQLGTHSPVELIIAALDDPEYAVRAEAITALRTHKERVPIEIFLKGLFIECDGGLPRQGERDFDCPAPVTAAQVLGELHDERAIQPLLTQLKHQEDEIRAAVIEALGELGEYVPLSSFLETLQDNSYYVRVNACKALEVQGKSGRALPIEPLLAALGDCDGDIIPLEDDACFYRNTDNGNVRQAAARALMTIQPQTLLALVPELYATLDGHTPSPLFDALVASQTVDIIRETGYAAPRFIEMLSQLLNHSYWEVRMKALQAITVLCTPLPEGVREHP